MNILIENDVSLVDTLVFISYSFISVVWPSYLLIQLVFAVDLSFHLVYSNKKEIPDTIPLV